MHSRLRTMKHLVPILLLGVLGSACCMAQQESHVIENGEGYGARTQAYDARAPYLLKWQVSKSAEVKNRAGHNVRIEAPGVAIHVCDAATRRILIKAASLPLDGQMPVSHTGRH